MAEPEPLRARASVSVVFPPEVWRHIKYFMLREFWHRKYSEAVAAVPRTVVLSTWTRKWWSSFSLVPNPNWNTTMLQRSVVRIMVDYESRDVDVRRCRPAVLGPQQAFYIVRTHVS